MTETDTNLTDRKTYFKRLLCNNNGVLLAPMVRIGTLPFRLLCLRHGADLVWSEEVIDIKLLKTRRIENEILHTIDYVLDDGTVVYQTCEEERGRNVLQIGTSSPERAALVVKHITPGDVAVIDLNMGCPKPFSIKGGMGAALLTKKETVRKILHAMVTNSHVPVMCKIRILPSIDDVLEIARIAEACGVVAVTVHGRTPAQETTCPNNEEAIARIAKSLSVPVIANGGSLVVSSRAEALRFRERTGTCAVMLARSALDNPSIFRCEGPRPVETTVPELLELCARYDLPTPLVKYTLPRIISAWNPRNDSSENTEATNLKEKWMNSVLSSISVADMLGIFDFSDQFKAEYAERHHQHCEFWRVRSTGDNLVCIPVEDEAKSFMVGGGNSPKDLLTAFCKKRKLSQPVYETTERDDRQFCSVVLVDEKRYTSGRIEQRKRVSEQTAALAALVYLDAFT